MSAKRSRGVIEAVVEDVDHDTVYLMGHFDGVGMTGFGGIVFDADARAAFEREVAAIFGVATLAECVGESCWGLWCRGAINEHMAGIETERGRVTISSFTKRHYPPEKWRDERQEVRRSLNSTIAHARRQIEEAEAELATFEADFIDWEAAPPSEFS